VAALPPGQQEVLRQILSMTPEQISVLPPEQQAKVLQVRRMHGLV
jgi:hypothetical protein